MLCVFCVCSAYALRVFYVSRYYCLVTFIGYQVICIGVLKQFEFNFGGACKDMFVDVMVMRIRL